MIAHFPYYQNPAVYRMQGRRWAREWAHKISRVPPEELPRASVRTIESYRIEADLLGDSNNPAFRDALFATGRYAVYKNGAAIIDNEGRGWFAQPKDRTVDNVDLGIGVGTQTITILQPRIDAPIDETITVREPIETRDTEWCRLDAGVVADIFTRETGGLSRFFSDPEAVVYYSLFALTGDGRVLAWGQETIGFSETGRAEFPSLAVSRVPTGDGWIGMQVLFPFSSGRPVNLGGGTYRYELTWAQHCVAWKADGTVATWGRAISFEDGGGSAWDFDATGSHEYTAPIMRVRKPKNERVFFVVGDGFNSVQQLVLMLDGNNRVQCPHPIFSADTGQYYDVPENVPQGYPPTVLTDENLTQEQRFLP